MPLGDFFKWGFRNILGIQDETNIQNDLFDLPNESNENQNHANRAKYFQKIWDETHDRDNSSNDIYGGDNFDIFNETLEIHRHMERQMNEMMKIFGMNIFDSPSHFPNNDYDNVDEYGTAPHNEGDIRDQYLKPGFHKNKAVDTDLDGLIAPKDLDKFMKKDNGGLSQNRTEVVPFQSNPSFFSRVVISRTITKPDGTTETHRTVKDSRNNEEETTVTITQKGSDNPVGDINPIYPLDESSMWRKFFKF